MPGAGSRRGGRAELIAGILLGIVLGLAVITAFVFLGSEDTIDAPRVTVPERQPGPEPAIRPDGARP